MNQFLEMQHLREAGVPLRQIVKAATINNARAFGLESQVGTSNQEESRSSFSSSGPLSKPSKHLADIVAARIHAGVCYS